MSRGSAEASPVSGTAGSPRASPPVTPGSPRRSPHRSPNRSPRNERSEASCASPAPSVGSAGSRDAPTDQRPPHHLFSPFDHASGPKKRFSCGISQNLVVLKLPKQLLHNLSAQMNNIRFIVRKKPITSSAPFKKEEERRLSHHHYLHQPYFGHRPLLAATAYPVCRVPKDVGRHSH
ncbi:hypothetical protein ABMA28_004997 [Loxostege sticticalis]|uniref:Uncharacterized protein n=1 Tax=Loxostege sticticalis TaxID=481309 RepID=A0ABD0SR97_LOXSC